MDLQRKLCPKCNTPAVIQDIACWKCKHVYRSPVSKKSSNFVIGSIALIVIGACVLMFIVMAVRGPDLTPLNPYTVSKNVHNGMTPMQVKELYGEPGEFTVSDNPPFRQDWRYTTISKESVLIEFENGVVCNFSDDLNQNEPLQTEMTDSIGTGRASTYVHEYQRRNPNGSYSTVRGHSRK